MRKYLCLLLAVAALAVVGACGGDDDGGGGESSPTNAIPSLSGPRDQPAPVQALDAAKVQPTDGVIEIHARDIQFVDNNLAVPVGEPTTIRVTNDDAVMHSLRIAGIDGQYGTEDDAVTTPESIAGGGGVGELVFAPAAAGYYTFRCDFHPESMGGQIVAGDPGTPPPTPPGTPTVAPESPLEGQSGGAAETTAGE